MNLLALYQVLAVHQSHSMLHEDGSNAFANGIKKSFAERLFHLLRFFSSQIVEALNLT